jgi:hypothetical protein
MVLTVSFVLSPVIGLFVTVIGVMRAPRRLGTSVEMPEPHDFAVRAQHRSPSMLPRPSHPAPNVRDDGDTPLLMARDARTMLLIWGNAQRCIAATHWHDGQISSRSQNLSSDKQLLRA